MSESSSSSGGDDYDTDDDIDAASRAHKNNESSSGDTRAWYDAIFNRQEYRKYCVDKRATELIAQGKASISEIVAHIVSKEDKSTWPPTNCAPWRKRFTASSRSIALRSTLDVKKHARRARFTRAPCASW